MKLQVQFLDSVTQIDSAEWDAVWASDYPFVQHAFLELLERSAATTAATGWKPCHLAIRAADRVVALMPLYEKYHSYGEYVFDWSWADAYQRAGYDYYPKLLNAIPFTPATGPRLAMLADLGEAEQAAVLDCLGQALHSQIQERGCSGFHSLFTDAKSAQRLAGMRLARRQGCQFHWFNQNFKDFDDFLAGFNSRKRKSLKRERSKVKAQGFELQIRSAKELSESDWEAFYLLYQRTYIKRSGSRGYLTRDFFMGLARVFPDQVAVATAHRDELVAPIFAAALYFRDSTTLYGRYWGAMDEVDGLHFETCYYQGIEYAIAQGLQRFDPGAQGEHKIQRGFTSVLTDSWHHLVHPQLQQAVASFVAEERPQIQAYCADARRYLPFKDGYLLPTDDALIQDSAED
ncbi:GNAT family N-acetyltransferase [Teredinibacter waterburyi]|uniref:GNAT family N-acetyltransferase n=1 Tax=Teredinibacter waterburyi TaxID=1500538 RepID=UPI00165F615D|nr:GNAT family N-acetyltransferase [Teredinibacter waterburyi]